VAAPLQHQYRVPVRQMVNPRNSSECSSCVQGSGFPGNLLELKARTAQQFPTLPKESPGSLWPKTTLGALKDKRRLTPQQLQDLIAMCKYTSPLSSPFGGMEDVSFIQPLAPPPPLPPPCPPGGVGGHITQASLSPLPACLTPQQLQDFIAMCKRAWT